jgi:transposase
MKTTTILKYAVGIDVSKKDFKCCIVSIDDRQQVKVKSSTHYLNNRVGFEALIQWVDKHCQSNIPVVYCMEATGIYHEPMALYLHSHGSHISVVLPTLSKNYLKSLGYKTKNDKIDAKGLATMAAEKALSCWRPFSESVYELRQMTRYIEELNQQRTATGNQLHALQHSMYPMEDLQCILKEHLAFIEKQIKELKSHVEGLLKQDAQLWSRAKHLMTIRGVGLHTIAVVIAETNGFTLFENIGQLCSYAGYDVVEHQSGERQGKGRISKKGNSHIRRALHMPSLSLLRYKVPIFHPLYERVMERTNVKMKGIVAIQRKLLTILYTLWNKQEDFNPAQNSTEKEVATTMVATQDELSAETASSLSIFQN